MVLRQALGHLLQRHDPGRRQNSCLPHTAAHHLAQAACFFDEICTAAQDGAHRGTQPFAQAKGHAIRCINQLPCRDVQRRGSVEDACSIDVQLHAVLMHQLGRPAGIFRADGHTTAAVLGIFQNEQL